MTIAICPKGHMTLVGTIRIRKSNRNPLSRNTRKRIHCVTCKRNYHRSRCKLERLKRR